jgi:hypothetical protein
MTGCSKKQLLFRNQKNTYIGENNIIERGMPKDITESLPLDNINNM